MAKRYSPEEDKLIVEAIKKNPYNLQACFRKVSKKINRAPKSIQRRWYFVLNNPEHPEYVGTAFTLLGRAMELKNGKIVSVNTVRRTPEKIAQRIWKTIKKLLKL